MTIFTALGEPWKLMTGYMVDNGMSILVDNTGQN